MFLNITPCAQAEYDPWLAGRTPPPEPPPPPEPEPSPEPDQGGD